MAIIFKRPKNYSDEDQFEFKVSSMGLFRFQDRLVLVLPEDYAACSKARPSRRSAPSPTWC